MGKNKNRNRGNNQIVDASPQILNMPKLTQTTINTLIEGKVATPVVNNVGQGGKALVMEILRVWVYATPPNIIAATIVSVSVSLNKKSVPAGTAFPSFEDSAVICQLVHQVDTLTSGVYPPVCIAQFDFTDGSGNGYLYGGKELFIQLVSANCAATQYKSASMKILYRMKMVNSNELVGILQE
jgi:hypothetical protein